ncbi:TerB family tellurite resistance protein [Rhizobium halophytocola]|uniref:Tellurite resistance protein B-like protein n=1 Tax=Rhizobium halophytocola TaxID=735519 RepID=A0ABS4E2W4_9HYPH|nr:TerB family tellurite resistance protein [Rhizobium halophytocola]MBP1852268.1 putative tellurite resistance protein B-like protein [Rhizobium halophytocola]
MFERLQSFFQDLVGPEKPSRFTRNDPRVAVAALCMQVMEADGVVRQSEKDKLRAALMRSYDLSDRELSELLAAGQEAESEAVDYYRFTTELKRHLDEDQRAQLIGILWDIVLADGERSEIEDHVVWRIADLLGVSNREMVLSRQDAMARAEGLTEATDGQS